MQDIMVHLDIEDRDGRIHLISVPANMGLNVMEVCKAEGLPIEGICGGLALCGSCHVYVLSGHHTGLRSEEEETMLDQLHHTGPNSRLCCQLRVAPTLDGLRLKLAPL